MRLQNAQVGTRQLMALPTTFTDAQPTPLFQFLVTLVVFNNHSMVMDTYEVILIPTQVAPDGMVTTELCGGNTFKVN